jgi:hypothetical protein
LRAILTLTSPTRLARRVRRLPSKPPNTLQPRDTLRLRFPAPLRSAMASAFIGISVVVTLQNPANTLVHGVVAAVNAQNSTLTLQDGGFFSLGMQGRDTC